MGLEQVMEQCYMYMHIKHGTLHNLEQVLANRPILNMVFNLQAFQELQNKLIATKQQVKVNDAQIEGLKRQNQHSAIVKSEISSLPNSTRAYQGVGRMWALYVFIRWLKWLDTSSYTRPAASYLLIYYMTSVTIRVIVWACHMGVVFPFLVYVSTSIEIWFIRSF